MSRDDDRQEAIKSEIGVLLSEYASLEREGAYVGEWTITAHLQSVALMANNRSEVWTVSPTGQSWPMTWGLLLAGLETEKGDMRPEVS